MPKVQVNEITINYDQQGTGEPLILIPYLAADYACYAFQVAEYAEELRYVIQQSFKYWGGERHLPSTIVSTVDGLFSQSLEGHNDRHQTVFL